MTLAQARAAGIRPNLDEETTVKTTEDTAPQELAPVDLLIYTECQVDDAGNVVTQQSVFIAKGDPIPADLAHLPRVDRDTLKPIRG